MRTLIKHGLIVDGNKTPAYEGDILIENEKILKISQDLNEEADKVIDAKGRVICPGFIDTHSHSDLVILVNPYNEVKIRQELQQKCWAKMVYLWPLYLKSIYLLGEKI